jgi:hypothetical protein
MRYIPLATAMAFALETSGFTKHLISVSTEPAAGHFAHLLSMKSVGIRERNIETICRQSAISFLLDHRGLARLNAVAQCGRWLRLRSSMPCQNCNSVWRAMVVNKRPKTNGAVTWVSHASRP